MATIAALACRASMQMAGRPAVASPLWSHCDKGPASKPTRSKVPSIPARTSLISAGSETAFPSRNIPPSASTTQMLVISSETSSPAYKTLVMVVLPVLDLPARRLPAFPGTEPRLRHLNGEIFYSLREAQILIEQWRIHYNTVRPHSSLGYRPPAPESIVPMDHRPTMQ